MSSDLFSYQPPARYPNGPGWTNETTSRAAAEKVAPRAGSDKHRIMAYIREAERDHRPPPIPEEISSALDILITTVRPRCTELVNGGWLIEACERVNDFGNKANAYRIAPPGTPPRPRKTTAAQERAAVVAWLRRQAADAGGMTEEEAAFGRAADAIEAGQHIKEEDRD